MTGRCHCGVNTLELVTRRQPEEFDVRACQCTFCRVHAALSISDPQGRLTYASSQPGTLIQYRFGLKLADFLICSRCGAYLGAFMSDEHGDYGVLNLNVLDARDRFGAPKAMVYDGESPEDRLARRRARWTPAVLRLATPA
jgi:hypothetical protein